MDPPTAYIYPIAYDRLVVLKGPETVLYGPGSSTGVDNIFDRTYAEHLSRGDSLIAGYEQTTQVNEPGRVFWVTEHSLLTFLQRTKSADD